MKNRQIRSKSRGFFLRWPQVYVLLAALFVAPMSPADIVLREDTASQARLIGPFVDSTGAPLTGLTIDAADVRLSKNGANIVGKNSGGCTHDELGMYTCTFDATDTNTVGSLQVMVSESGALIFKENWQVVEEAVYDACCAAAAAPVTAADFWAYGGGRTLSAATNITSTGGTITVSSGAVTVGTNNDKTNYTLSAAGIDSIWDEATSGHVTAGSFGAALSDVLTDTGTTLPAAIAAIDAIVDQLLIGVNVEQINGVTVLGAGTAASPWNGE